MGTTKAFQEGRGQGRPVSGACRQVFGGRLMPPHHRCAVCRALGSGSVQVPGAPQASPHLGRERSFTFPQGSKPAACLVRATHSYLQS